MRLPLIGTIHELAAALVLLIEVVLVLGDAVEEEMKVVLQGQIGFEVLEKFALSGSGFLLEQLHRREYMHR